MIDREKLQSAIAQAILPYTKEPTPQDSNEESADEEDYLNDPFVIGTSSYIAQEVLESGIEIEEDQADLDDENLENLPLFNILSSLLTELLSISSPLPVISNIIQTYFTPEADSRTHYHIRNGPCEVFPVPVPIPIRFLSLSLACPCPPSIIPTQCPYTPIRYTNTNPALRPFHGPYIPPPDPPLNPPHPPQTQHLHPHRNDLPRSLDMSILSQCNPFDV